MVVYKKFNIESARSLPHVSKKHPCYQIHGHSFEIIIKVEGNIDKKSGFVIDFQDIEDSFEPLRKLLDHSYLMILKASKTQLVKICVCMYGKILSRLYQI